MSFWSEIWNDDVEPYLTAIDIKPLSFYRNLEKLEEALRVIVGRWWVFIGISALQSIPNLWGFDTWTNGWLLIPFLLITWIIVPIVCIFCLSPFAFFSMLSLIIATPLGVAALILYTLYGDLHLDRILTTYFLSLFSWTAFLSLPISFLSAITTTWCIFRAQPYLSWSIAGLGKHILEALIGFKIIPVFGAIVLWVVAPTIGQYVPDGAFWARLAGVAWIVFTMPSIFWKAAVKVLTGLDHMAKRRRTRSQNVYGADGFANPHEAARAMSSVSYDG